MITTERALAHHTEGRPRKRSVVPTRPAPTVDALADHSGTRGLGPAALHPVDPGGRLAVGPHDTIPKPFDLRVLLHRPAAVPLAAIGSGAVRAVPDPEVHRAELERPIRETSTL